MNIDQRCLDALARLNGRRAELSHDVRTVLNLVETLQRELTRRGVELEDANGKRHGVWHWGGDEHDHLESLTCPVLIAAADLRAIIDERDEMRMTYKD